MRLGLALPHYDTSFGGAPASWDGVARCARAAEEAGFHSLWVSDHLFLDWSKYGGPATAQGSLECWTTMSALAAMTSRVRIGSLTSCNDFRNPALLAKMAASLDLLSGGRLDVGMGAGWYDPEYVAAGIDFDRAGIRIDRLGEAVEIVTRLLSGEELAYQGRFYEIKGAICRPRPTQEPRPPVWIGGKGDRLLATAARVADGWNFSWVGAGSIDGYHERAAAADRACEQAGRDPQTLRRSAGAYLLAGKDERDAERRFERLAGRTPDGVLPAASDGAAVSWEGFKQKAIAGAVDEVVDKLGPLADLGVEEVVVSLGTLPFQVADIEDIELVGHEIVPALG